MAQQQITLYYIHDPMCSWCWGFRPVWDALQARLPTTIKLVYVAGGLARDSDEPMPQAMQVTIQGYWQQIHEQLGTEFNFDFWTHNQPRRSTYWSCRATIAAGLQGQDLVAKMVDAIQRAYYLRALNPSDCQVLEQLAQELGLDVERFSSDLRSTAVQRELESQLGLARRLPISGFPSLVLSNQTMYRPIAVSYDNVDAMLRVIEDELVVLTLADFN